MMGASWVFFSEVMPEAYVGALKMRGGLHAGPVCGGECALCAQKFSA
jgi:hypothetical protein